jgi:hypothetical protein
MRRNPLFIFKELHSMGIYDVPLKSTVHIIDSDGRGTPKFIQLIGKHLLSPDSTIADLLALPENYIDLMLVGEVYSELELIAENGKTGWRLRGRDPLYYGNIGEEAIDFSKSNEASEHRGALGDFSFAINSDTSAWGINSFVAGNQTIAGFPNQFVVGQWNQNNANNIFEIGIGTGKFDRRNALEISKQGVLLAPSLETSDIVDSKSLITKEYFENHVMQEGGELKKVRETNGNTGYRIAERDNCPWDNYDTIGQEAVDLSCSTMCGGSNGASGNYSFAAGLNVIQRNEAGAVFGKFNLPKDDTIFEIGNGSGFAPNTHSNALEVYMDGKILAPSLDNSKITEDKSLVTKGYLKDVSRVVVKKFDQDIIDPSRTSYGFNIDNFELDSVDVFMNGILLRENHQYTIQRTSVGIQINFDSNFVAHYGDWLRVQVATLEY